MRLPLIARPISPPNKPLYDSMRKGIASNFNAFKVEREDGALMGPWNPWLHETGHRQGNLGSDPGDDRQRRPDRQCAPDRDTGGRGAFRMPPMRSMPISRLQNAKA